MALGGRLAILLKVLLVFVLLGPPVGALTFFLGLGIYGVSDSADFSALMWVLLFGLIYGLPLSYPIGSIPAAIAGLILGATAAFHRVPGFLLSVATGTLVGLGLVYSGGRPVLAHNAEGAPDYASAALLIATCLVATVLCWGVARSVISRPSASSMASAPPGGPQE